MIAIFVAWGIMVWIRKTMWDAVHRNLLDLLDHYDGEVVRRSFAARPIFHGKLNGVTVTLNFSSERTAGKRINYIDISYAAGSSFNATISDKAWLEKQDAGELEDFETVTNENGRPFIVRPASDPKVKAWLKTPLFSEIINRFNGLAYIFLGKSGTLCEFISDDIIRSTKFENLNPKLILIEKLGKQNL